MAISSNLTFNETQIQLITDALQEVGLSPDAMQNLSDNDYQSAARKLNRMILAWQAYDLHLWLRTQATLFLQKNQYIYELKNSTTGDHCTNSYVETTLADDVASSDTIITVEDVIDMAVNDHIGIILDSGATYWTTITAINTGTNEITLDNAPGGSGTVASSGNFLHTYTLKIQRPLRILQGRRYLYNGATDILIGDQNGGSLAQEDYFALPTKSTPGTVVSWFYDPQIPTGNLYVWNAPSDSSYAMKFTYCRQIADFLDITDTADFPTEWQEALVYGLAARLCTTYGQSTRYPIIKDLADSALKVLLAYDTEKTYLEVSPSRY